jgi:tRNA pseudouridine38-40 synthase
MLIYKSNIAYDGTEFQGFQSQRSVRTVQDVIEDALRQIGWQGSRIQASGRTDSGVHARGQVISFTMSWDHGTERLTHALNANLPKDVAVRCTETADEGFHPRFSAIRRRYSYRILCCPVRSPLDERYAWRIWPQPDVSLMNELAAQLPGERDFGAFGRAPIPGGHTVRHLYNADWTLSGSEMLLNIEANAFLYHMVRRLVAVMTTVGYGREAVDEVVKLFHEPGASWDGTLAPSCGLCLEEVSY